MAEFPSCSSMPVTLPGVLLFQGLSGSCMTPVREVTIGPTLGRSHVPRISFCWSVGAKEMSKVEGGAWSALDLVLGMAADLNSGAVARYELRRGVGGC
jgi:hypothetical protein